MHDFYFKMKRDLSEAFNAEGFEKDYTIRDNVDQKNIIVDLKTPLFAGTEAREMFEEILKSVVTFFCWDLVMNRKPAFAFISPTCVIVQKAFDDRDFK